MLTLVRKLIMKILNLKLVMLLNARNLFEEVCAIKNVKKTVP